MSTPTVAGAISLLWSAVPKLKRDIATTNKILLETSLKQESTQCNSPSKTPNYVFGHGTINILKAYEKAKEMGF